MEGEWSLPPLLRIERCLLCPCNAGACRLKTSQTQANPGRRFYKCPAPEQCPYGTNGFFKWENQVKANEFIDVPYCGGCMAGPCRVRRETKGTDAGRVLFLCTVKEGQGSCGYRVFQDDLEMSSRAGLNPNITPPPITLTNCNGTNPPNIGLVEENIPSENLKDDQSPVISTSPRLRNRRSTSRKPKQSKLQEDEPGEPLRPPLKRSRTGSQGPGSFVSSHSHTLPLVMTSVLVKQQWWMTIAIDQNLGPQLQGWWGRLAFYPLPRLIIPASEPSTDCYFAVAEQDKDLVNSYDSTTLVASLLGNESSLLSDSTDGTPNENLQNYAASPNVINNPLTADSSSQSLYTHCNSELVSGIKPFSAAHDVPSCNKPFGKTKFNNVISESISKAFEQAAEQLRNDLFTLLENMDSKDHEAMKQEAEATFAALDRLCIDHKHLDKRVNEFINCSSSLAAVDQSIPMPAYQELELRCKFERLKLDEIESAHTKAVETVIRSRESLKVVQDMISSTNEWLFQVEAEFVCSEVELRNMEVQLEKKLKEKQILEGNYLITSKELEDFAKLHEQREVAKAAFEKAKALLRHG